MRWCRRSHVEGGIATHTTHIGPYGLHSPNCPNDEADRVVSDGTFSGEDVMPIQVDATLHVGGIGIGPAASQRRTGWQGDDRDDRLGHQV